MVKELFKHLKLPENLFTLKNIVIGYKRKYTEYDEVNILLTFISFSIYKAHYVSEQRHKIINITNILKNHISLWLEVCKYRKTKLPILLVKTKNFLDAQ